jgi:hypothetical protein
MILTVWGDEEEEEEEEWGGRGGEKETRAGREERMEREGRYMRIPLNTSASH